MKDVRIGNDISVIWSLYSDQKPFLLDGLKISVYLKGMYGKTKIEDYTIKDNEIHWTFFGKDQKHTGKYSLTLVVNEGAEGMVTTDVCDLVRLVSCTCQADGTDEDGVQTETIAVNSEVELLSGGFGRIDTALDPMSENAVSNRVITAEFGKVNEATSGLKTQIADDKAEVDAQLTELSEEKEDKANKTTTISAASTDTQYPSAKATFTAISEKSKVSLEALANGNFKVTINGESKDFMPATPSGDPQHYAFIAIGAKYNATANDSRVAAPWATLADDAADKVVIHKAGHWLLNGVGDLTNRDMRHILARGVVVPGTPYSMANAISNHYNEDNNPGANAVRTNYCFAGTANFTVELGAFFNNQVIEVALLSARPNGAHGIIEIKTTYFARLAMNLRHIVGNCVPIDTNADAFTSSPLLKTIDVRDLKYNINFKDQPLLTNASILNMINKEKATSAIVITLHADAYARATANTDILSALSAHPNVSLAKA